MHTDFVTEGVEQKFLDAFRKVTYHLGSLEHNECCRADVHPGTRPVQRFDRADYGWHHSAGDSSRDEGPDLPLSLYYTQSAVQGAPPRPPMLESAVAN